MIIVKYTLENARGSPSSYFSESSKEKKVKGLTFKRCPCIRNIGNIKKQNFFEINLNTHLDGDIPTWRKTIPGDLKT